jgi:hypothetical protein
MRIKSTLLTVTVAIPLTNHDTLHLPVLVLHQSMYLMQTNNIIAVMKIVRRIKTVTPRVNGESEAPSPAGPRDTISATRRITVFWVRLAVLSWVILLKIN